jgi:hypothetical protein
MNQICPISGRICLGYAGYVRLRGLICPDNLDLTLRQSRSGAKTMNLDPDKLTTYKLNTIELREINGTIRSNLITPRVMSNSM